MMYKTVIIVSSNAINFNYNDYELINGPIKLKDKNHLYTEYSEYEFNYLVIDDSFDNNFNNILLLENNKPVVNFFHETSVENIYYCPKELLNNVLNDLLEDN